MCLGEEKEFFLPVPPFIPLPSSSDVSREKKKEKRSFKKGQEGLDATGWKTNTRRMRNSSLGRELFV